jgi:DNA-binding NtrC family response regulator
MQNNINILVVDDEEIMRDLFTDILQDQGYKVTTVTNGKEAEDKVRDTFFPIAFIDIHMPVMNGLQAMLAIKKISPTTAVVMMDSFPDVLLEETQRKGAITCIHKPFDIKEVIGAIEQILGGKKKEE